MTIASSVLGGDRLALARLLTQIENDTPEGLTALRALFPSTGRAHLVGITGAPGTGKSSLVNRLALRYRESGRRVAVAAVDPSSPFTGGAVLGDRIRMKDLSGDEGVFIRSMASRGALGGLARATAGVVQAFDAAGYEVILVETVGAGQGEIDIVRLAHTTIVVEAPGLGDDIQAIKAGILEIADILVVNKADRPGVENTVKALRSMLELSRPMQVDAGHHGPSAEPGIAEPGPQDGWTVPICQTIATEGGGIPELLGAIDRHGQYLRESGQWSRREEARLRAEVGADVEHGLLLKFRKSVREERYNEVMQLVFNRSISPGEAAEVLVLESEHIHIQNPPGLKAD